MAVVDPDRTEAAQCVRPEHPIQVRKGRATVHDCVDLSQAGLKNARTGLALPHSFGSPRANYYASLVLQGGRWLVSNIVPVVAPCDS